MEDSPAAIRQWFQSLMQPDQPDMSCCGEADAFETDTFEVEGRPLRRHHHRRQGRESKRHAHPGTQRQDEMDQGNPTGHAITFIGSQGQVCCYVAPGGV